MGNIVKEQRVEATAPQSPVSKPRRLLAWCCDDCNYWRQTKSSGVHMTTDPSNPSGGLVAHHLREVEFVETLTGGSAATESPE